MQKFRLAAVAVAVLLAGTGCEMQTASDNSASDPLVASPATGVYESTSGSPATFGLVMPDNTYYVSDWSTVMYQGKASQPAVDDLLEDRQAHAYFIQDGDDDWSHMTAPFRQGLDFMPTFEGLSTNQTDTYALAQVSMPAVAVDDMVGNYQGDIISGAPEEHLSITFDGKGKLTGASATAGSTCGVTGTVSLAAGLTGVYAISLVYGTLSQVDPDDPTFVPCTSTLAGHTFTGIAFNDPYDFGYLRVMAQADDKTLGVLVDADKCAFWDDQNGRCDALY